MLQVYGAKGPGVRGLRAYGFSVHVGIPRVPMRRVVLVVYCRQEWGPTEFTPKAW